MTMLRGYSASFVSIVLVLTASIFFPCSAAYAQAETPTETPTATPTASPTLTPTFTITPTPTPSLAETQTATPSPLPDAFISTVYGMFPWVIMNGIQEFSSYGSTGSHVMGTHPSTGELYLLSKATNSEIYDLTRINPLSFLQQTSRVGLAFSFNGKGDYLENLFSLNVLSNGDFMVGGYSDNRHEVILEVSLENPVLAKPVVYYSDRGQYYHDFYVLNPQENLKGFSEEGVLVVKENQLVLVQDSSITPVADLPVPEHPIPYYTIQINRTNIFRGPDQHLYIGYYISFAGEEGVSYIFRIEADRTLSQVFGKFNHFPRFYLADITYNSFNNHFYFTDTRDLYQANADFSTILKIGEPNSSINNYSELDYSEQGNVVWLRSNHQFATIYKLTANPDVLPSPTPTSTPYSSSTFRPTPNVNTNVNQLTVLEPSFSINLLSNASVEQFSLIPGKDQFIYSKTEPQQISWTGYVRTENFLRIYGPAKVSTHAIPQNQITSWGQFQLGNITDFRKYQLTSLSNQKQLVIYPNQDAYLLSLAKQTRLSNQAKKFSISPSSGIYIGVDNTFMNVPPGNALLYEYRSNGNYFYSFDPSQDEIQLNEIVLSQTIDAFSHFHWGPSGLLHALIQNPYTRESGLYRFSVNGTQEIINHLPYQDIVDIVYLPLDDSFYFIENKFNLYVLYRLPNKYGEPQPILTFPRTYNLYRASNWEVLNDGTTLFFNTENNIYSLQTNTAPGVPISTPTPTTGMPLPTPTPMDWIIMDGFGGLHISRTEVERPLLPYFAPFDIARDLEPDPMGRGWYMLDGFGGIHPSSPELPMPSSGIPYILGFDFAVNLEIVMMNGNYNFIILDRFGSVHKLGPDIHNIQVDAPWFGNTALARDLELAETKDAWMVMDGYGVLYDAHDFSVKLATDAFWFKERLAKGLSVLPDGERFMIDAYGGLHANKPETFVKLRSFANTPYIPGYDIFWDIEVIHSDVP